MEQEFPVELIPAGTIQPAVLSLAVGPCPTLIFPDCNSSRRRSVALASRAVSLGTLRSVCHSKKIKRTPIHVERVVLKDPLGALENNISVAQSCASGSAFSCSGV